MKNIRIWLLAVAAVILPISAIAQVYGPTSGSVSGAAIVGTVGTTETLPTITDTLAGLATPQTFTAADGFSGGITTQSQAFSTALAGNPLLLTNTTAISSMGQLNAGVVVLTSNAARTISPGFGMSFLFSGTPATCTGIQLKCQPSGRNIAVLSASLFTSLIPVGLGGVTASSNIGQGAQQCASGDAIIASQVGGQCTTATNLIISIPYTVQ